MARIGKLYRRSQSGTYYCKVDGKQTRLGPTEAIAKKERDKLVAKHGIVVVNGSRKPTVEDMVTHYLAWHKANRAASSHSQRVNAFKSLTDMFGDRDAESLSPANVLRWVETSYGKCGNTRQNDLLSWVQTAFNWIERTHGIPSKLKRLDKPTKDQREYWLPVCEWQTVLDACTSNIRDVVEFMLLTGARPQEARILKPHHWVKRRSQFVLKASESKGGKVSRVIYVPQEFAPRIEKLIKAKNTYVFTNHRGQQWSNTAFNSAARRIKKKTGIAEFCMYSCRHGFAVERIVEAGLDLAIVSKLLGHASTEMVYKKYGHLSQQVDLLSNAVNAKRK